MYVCLLMSTFVLACCASSSQLSSNDICFTCWLCSLRCHLFPLKYRPWFDVLIALEVIDSAIRLSCTAAPPRQAKHRFSSTQKGKVERGMGLWSPIGDSPFGNRLPKGRQLVIRSSLAMLVPLSTSPFRYDLKRTSYDDDDDILVTIWRCYEENWLCWI